MFDHRLSHLQKTDNFEAGSCNLCTFSHVPLSVCVARHYRKGALLWPSMMTVLVPSAARGARRRCTCLRPAIWHTLGDFILRPPIILVRARCSAVTVISVDVTVHLWPRNTVRSRGVHACRSGVHPSRAGSTREHEEDLQVRRLDLTRAMRRLGVRVSE